MNLLKGAVEFHVHGSPCLSPRILSDYQLAELASRKEMAGIVLKSHQGSTVERAILVQEKNPSVKVMGGLVLNHCVGGLNLVAVETFLKLGAKIIWMPTMSARSQFFRSTRHTVYPFSINKPEDGITVLDSKGRLSRKSRQIMELTGEYDAVLGTGHLSLNEIYQLAEYAKVIGFKKLVFNHPDAHTDPAPLKDQIILAQMGVYLEKCYRNILYPPGFLLPEKMAEGMRKIGVQHCLLATDMGQLNYVHPIQGLENFTNSLLPLGFTEGEIRIMVSDHPKRLLNMNDNGHN